MPAIANDILGLLQALRVLVLVCSRVILLHVMCRMLYGRYMLVASGAMNMSMRLRHSMRRSGEKYETTRDPEG